VGHRGAPWDVLWHCGIRGIELSVLSSSLAWSRATTRIQNGGNQSITCILYATQPMTRPGKFTHWDCTVCKLCEVFRTTVYNIIFRTLCIYGLDCAVSPTSKLKPSQRNDTASRHCQAASTAHIERLFCRIYAVV
jgi:hypothetical protein